MSNGWNLGRKIDSASSRFIRWLVGLCLLTVIPMRMLQFSILLQSQHDPPATILVEKGSLFFAILLCSVALGVILPKFLPKLSGLVLAAVVTLLGFAACGIAWKVAPWYMSEWVSPYAFQVVRWDILLFLGLGLSVLWISSTKRTWVRRVSIVALTIVVFLTVLVVTWDLGYLVKTGIPLPASMLGHFVLNFGDLAPIVAEEVNFQIVLLLLLPIVVVALPLTAYLLPRSGRAMTPVGVTLASVPAILLLALFPGEKLSQYYQTNFIPGLVTEIASESSDEAASVEIIANNEPTFDTHALTVAETPETKRMNIIFIVLESVRSISVTPYNPSLETTPFIDSLAHHGVMIDEMYAVIPHTNKSLVTLFGGIYPAFGHKVVEGEPGGIPGPGLPSLVAPSGYASGFFTPAMLSFEHKDRILANLGFEHVMGDGDYDPNGFARINPLGFEDRITLPSIFRWIDDLGRARKPFVMGYLSMTTHHPYQTPPDFPRRDFPAPGRQGEELEDYLNAIRYSDDFIRELVHGLARRNLLDETILVILGDHGEAFSEHGQNFHADILYEEAIKVPAVLYSPKLFEKPTHITGPRQMLDIVPTILDTLGFEVSGGTFPGRSLFEAPDPDRTLYYTSWSERYALALRRGDRKFLFYYNTRPGQVFDIGSDPGELNDLAGSLDADQKRELTNDVLRWRLGTKAAYAKALRTSSGPS